MLFGSLPENVCKLKRLLALDVSQCSFSGQVPQCIWEMNSLEILIINDNKLLSGNIDVGPNMEILLGLRTALSGTVRVFANAGLCVRCLMH